MSNHWHLILWHSSSYVKTKIFPTLTYIAYSDCQITSHHSFWKKENSLFTPCLDKLFSLWNNAVHWMNYQVCTAGRYRETSILSRVHAAFFNHHQFDAVTYMTDEIVLTGMMTALDLEFEKAMHYHDEGYEVTVIMDYQLRLWDLCTFYSVSTTESSFNLAD